MVSDSSFHGATRIVVLHSEPDVRHQASVVLWNCALHLFSNAKFNQSINRLWLANQEKRESDFPEKQTEPGRPENEIKLKIVWSGGKKPWSLWTESEGSSRAWSPIRESEPRGGNFCWLLRGRSSLLLRETWK